MAYTDLLEEEGINAQYLAVLRPARRVSSFTSTGGGIYTSSFDYGYVYSISVNGAALTLASSTALSAGEYYYDHEAQTIYVRKSDSTAPNSTTDFVIVNYELFVATFDAHWHRVPTDTATTEVYFDPLIQNVPVIKSSVSDLLFGVMPTQTTSISLINAEHVFEKHLYDSSFLNKEILIYHWLDDLAQTNIKLVARGRMGDVSYTRSTIQIKVFDNLNTFEKEFRSTQEFYNTTDFPNLDPQFEGAPIRTVYGVVDGFVPVNIDFVRDNPTTSDNREWAVRADGASRNDITRTVPASPSSTTTRTYLNDATGFKVGDSVWLDKGTDEYVFVTAVDHSANYIEHAAISVACTAGDLAKRSSVGLVEIISQNIRYRAHFNRDYTVSTHASGVLQFTFSTSLESNLSIPQTLSSADRVYCRVYGKQNSVTLSGSPLGTNSDNLGNLTNLSVILFDVLKTYAGLSESDINLSSVSSLVAVVDDEIGFAVPKKARDKYPKVKSVIVDILSSGLLKLYLDFDQKWKLSRLAPITSTVKEIADDEILRGSVEYSFDYSDICSDFVLDYNYQETTELGQEGKSTQKVSANIAKYLHGISKTFEHDSLHINDNEALTLITRLSYTLGDRRGQMSFATKNRFFDSIVNDEITVSSTQLPGFNYDEDVEQTRDFSVEQIDKSLRSVKITLSDQKGVEDNSGSW